MYLYTHSCIIPIFDSSPPSTLSPCVSMPACPMQHLEDTHALGAQRKATLDELWQEFQRETKHYKDSTEERKLRFEALKKKDEESAMTIDKQMKRLQKLQVRRYTSKGEHTCTRYVIM